MNWMVGKIIICCILLCKLFPSFYSFNLYLIILVLIYFESGLWHYVLAKSSVCGFERDGSKCFYNLDK